MLLKVITRFGLATHLALLAAVPLALFPFVKPWNLVGVVAWLLLFAVAWMFMEPSRKSSESRLSVARERVFWDIFHDPVFYYFLVAIIFALVRWINTGIQLTYQLEQQKWVVDEPLMSVMPASVGQSGYMPFMITLLLLVVIMGLRHALGSKARLWFAMLFSLLVGAGAMAAVVKCCQGEAVFISYALSPFDQVNLPVVFSSLLLPLTIAAGCQAEGLKWGKLRIGFSLAVMMHISAMLFFEKSFIVAIVFGFSLIYFIYCIVMTARAKRGGAATRFFFFFLLGVVLAACLFAAFAPEAVKTAKLAALDPDNVFTAEMASLRKAYTRLSVAMWLKMPWLGGGVGSYGIHLPFFATAQDWAVVPMKTQMATCSFWTLLVERGIIGCGLLLSGICMLVYSYLARGWSAFKFQRNDEASDIFIFANPPVVWATIPLLVILFVEMFYLPVMLFDALPVVFCVTITLATMAFRRVDNKKNK